MAQLADIDMPPDLIRQLDALENMDEWADEILTECAEIFADNLRSNLRGHRDTGDLIDAIQVGKPENKGKIRSVTVLNSKAKTRGTRNALKLAELEYGNSDQAATPVVAPARAASEEKIRAVFERRIKARMK